MLNIVAMAGEGTDAAGEVTLYEKLKILKEWICDCLTCRLPCCLNDDYNNFNEEEGEQSQQQPPHDLHPQTEPMQIEIAGSPSKISHDEAKKFEEMKIDVKPLENRTESNTPNATKTLEEKKSPTEIKSPTHFDDLELTSLNSLSKKLPIEQYPKGEFFIISSSHCHLLAKIREVKLNTPYSFIAAEEEWKNEDEENNSKEKDANFSEFQDDYQLHLVYEERYTLFSEYRKGIKISREDWLSATPELIAQHVAKRLGDKFRTVLDAFCGAGGNTIQLAHQCESVYAVESSKQKIENLKSNAEIYHVADKIEFVEKDFFHADSAKADVVFINLGIREEYSLLKDNEITLDKILDTAFKISDNFALLAPSRTKVEEFVEILYEIIEKHETASKRSIVEIEHIKVDDMNSAILILYGDASSVSAEDEIKALETILKTKGKEPFDLATTSQNEGIWKAFKLCVQKLEIENNDSINI